jgi:hypothetical protein
MKYQNNILKKLLFISNAVLAFYVLDATYAQDVILRARLDGKQYLPPANQIPSRSSINIVHQKQERNLCVPTSASMMLSKFGWNYPPRQIKLASLNMPYYGSNTPFNHWTGMSTLELMNGIRYIGITTWRTEFFLLSDFDNALKEIKSSVSSGYPVMILVTIANVGHALVVSGYDDTTQKIKVNDPAMKFPGITYYSYSQLKTVWSNRFARRGAVFMTGKPLQQAVIMRASVSSNNSSENIKY